jgi:hypothetical protein
VPQPAPFLELQTGDERDLVSTSRRIMRELLSVEVDQVEATLLPLVLSVYRDARIAGLCHDGACELARGQLRSQLARLGDTA